MERLGPDMDQHDKGVLMTWIMDANVEIERLRGEVERLRLKIDGARMRLGIALGPKLEGQEPVRGREWREIAEQVYAALAPPPAEGGA